MPQQTAKANTRSHWWHRKSDKWMWYKLMRNKYIYQLRRGDWRNMYGGSRERERTSPVIWCLRKMHHVLLVQPFSHQAHTVALQDAVYRSHISCFDSYINLIHIPRLKYCTVSHDCLCWAILNTFLLHWFENIEMLQCSIKYVWRLRWDAGYNNFT